VSRNCAAKADDDFAPTATWDMLRRRAELLARVRTFFDSRGFVEVDTPLLSADTVVDRHIDPISVTLPDEPSQPGVGRRLWLQTSPEFAMKRLLTAGAEAIYQITHAFRAGERGPLHNVEFTILEWYRVGDSYQQGMQLLADFAAELIGRGQPNLLTFRDVFLQFAWVDPFTAELSELRDAVHQHGISIPVGMDKDRDGMLDLMLVHCIEPQLGTSQPTILFDYPASQAALAQVRDDAPPVAERFELYADGLELANGYHELLDSETLRQRNRHTNQLRQADGKAVVPEESRLLSAMNHGLPPCCGVALGMDRLLMLLTGAKHIDQVVAFPIERA